MPNDIKFNDENLEDPVEGSDDDLLASLLEDERAQEEPAKVDPKVSDLEAKVQELEKANAGLLKAKQAETNKRQDAHDRLLQLEGAVGSILSQRQQQGMESVTAKQAADANAMGIPVEYDDDGNGWIDPASIQSLVSPYEQRINELEAALQQTTAVSAAENNAQKVMDAIIGSDERFGPASGRYRAARSWVEGKVSEYAQANNITGRTIQSGEALDRAFDDLTRQQFEAQFPGINLVSIVTAEDSEAQFRMALENVASTMNTTQGNAQGQMDSRFQKVMNKPSTLGNQANAKAGEVSLMDRLTNISTQDIMDLSDKDIDTLMKAVSKG